MLKVLFSIFISSTIELSTTNDALPLFFADVVNTSSMVPLCVAQVGCSGLRSRKNKSQSLAAQTNLTNPYLCRSPPCTSSGRSTGLKSGFFTCGIFWTSKCLLNGLNLHTRHFLLYNFHKGA